MARHKWNNNSTDTRLQTVIMEFTWNKVTKCDQLSALCSSDTRQMCSDYHTNFKTTTGLSRLPQPGRGTACQQLSRLHRHLTHLRNASKLNFFPQFSVLKDAVYP